MGLLSFLKRQGPAEAAESPAASTPDAVVVARTNARRRLIGAAVLLAIGVIGFPLLFETQPRPIAVDIPISIPNKDRAAPLVLSPAPAASARPLAPAEPMEATERQSEQGREVPPPAPGASKPVGPARSSAASAPVPAAPVAAVKPEPAPSPASAPAPAAAPTPAPETLAAAKPAPTPSTAASKPAPVATKPAVEPPPSAAKKDAARAQALLDGKQPAASDDAARVVVQVGAFTEPDKMRQARSKLEGLGFKTYTQAVEVGGERRIRVRVGPFSNRAEADKAAARIKAAGLPAAILTL